MVKHYFKIAFRNLWKYKQQNIISVLGLAIGFVCFSLSMVWIKSEHSYDSFHPKSDRIYAVVINNRGDESSKVFAYGQVATHLKSVFPEIEEATTVFRSREMATPSTSPITMDALVVDNSFSRVFDLSVPQIDFSDHKFIELESYRMDGFTSIDEPDVPIAISEEASKKLFTDQDPVGKTIEILLDPLFKVRYKVATWPKNTNIPFDFIYPAVPDEKPNQLVLAPIDPDRFVKNQRFSFVLIREGVDIESFKKKIENYRFGGANVQIYKDADVQASIVPIQALHLLGLDENGAESQKRYAQVQLYAFSGLLIALCAMFNYLTLFISRMRMRGRELSLRKVSGASDRSLISLFCIEFLTLLSCSLLPGVLLVEIALPSFKTLAAIDMHETFILMQTAIYTCLLILTMMLVCIIPIYYYKQKTLHSFLKDNSTGKEKNLFNRAITFLQLFICIGFIFCSFIFMKQLHHMTQTDLGFDRTRAVQARISFGMMFDLSPFVDKMRGIEGITDIRAIRDITHQPTVYKNLSSVADNAENKDYELEFESYDINPDFIPFWNINVLQGRNFEDDDLGKNRCVINEAMVKALGWSDPVGRTIHGGYDNEAKQIVGVVKDFYMQDPKQPLKPLLLTFREKEEYTISYRYKESANKQDIEKAVADIFEKNYPARFPSQPMRFTYTEDFYGEYFESENNLLFLLQIATGICIIVSAFGVYSMVSLTCTRRRKEIAIRKVNGATTQLIFINLLREYMMLVCIAALVAFPVGYKIMSAWLENYVLHTEIDVWIYLLILVGTLGITTLTVFSQVWRAANQNPAKILKSE